MVRLCPVPVQRGTTGQSDGPGKAGLDCGMVKPRVATCRHCMVQLSAGNGEALVGEGLVRRCGGAVEQSGVLVAHRRVTFSSGSVRCGAGDA